MGKARASLFVQKRLTNGSIDEIRAKKCAGSENVAFPITSANRRKLRVARAA